MKKSSFNQVTYWMLAAFCTGMFCCRPQAGSNNSSGQSVAQPTQNDSIIEQKKREKAALPAKLDTIKVNINAKKTEEE